MVFDELVPVGLCVVILGGGIIILNKPSTTYCTDYEKNTKVQHGNRNQNRGEYAPPPSNSGRGRNMGRNAEPKCDLISLVLPRNYPPWSSLDSSGTRVLRLS